MSRDFRRFSHVAWMSALLVLCGCGQSATQTGPGAVGGTGSDTAGLDLNLGSDGEAETVTSDGSGAETVADAPEPSDLLIGTDTSAGDLPSVDAGICTGAAGCTCKANGECDSGFCIDTQKGQVCAQTCSTDCAEGFACKAVASGNDLVNICVPKLPNLCEPCKTDNDCKALGATALCVAYSDEAGQAIGSFCGGACSDTDPCPTGYGCADVPTSGGNTVKQCKKTDLACTCSSHAVQLKLATSCSASNAVGTCKGTRSCGEGGLSACDAISAAAETCDAVDNDCNGKTDDATCDDKNPCTSDSCNSTTKECLHEALAGPCDDGNLCTTGDTCATGACTSQPKKCDDDNPCTDDTCDPAKGCGYENATGPCSTGNACESGGKCLDGQCSGAKPKGCDDANGCTIDFCDAKIGECQHKSVDAACDDSNPCTSNDLCVEGLCLGKPKNCDDKNSCTDDTCDQNTGCKQTTNADACDDGNACSQGDTCDAGSCKGQSVSCDDKNACTNDSCDAKTGCQHAGLSTPCNDDNACTQGDACTDGLCAGKAVVCDDNNPCTDDACNLASGCTSTANGLGCDDNNACTQGDVCQSGVCKGAAAVSCDDKNSCTNDSCDIKTGCQNTQVNSPCDDGNACTQGDSCASGGCVGKPVSCDDKNACTDDACDPLLGCKSTANLSGCDDANACTTNDLCSGGTCKGQGGLNCDDGNPCTTDTCSTAGGCKNANSTAPCDDGNPCTEGDKCGGGDCSAGTPVACDDKNPCTDEVCNPKSGACGFTVNAAACDDGNACTTGDKCASGQCGGKAISCDDGNACTTDSCDKVKGSCTQVNSTDACDDGSACTQNDACQAGACKGAVISCDDKNTCTTDSCDVKSGCASVKNSALCNDGDACTSGDSCADGACKGAAVSCDDKNPCTNDLCDKNTGCANNANTAVCNDGSACTSSDTCGGGVCLGKPVPCDDKNPCTTDSCDKTTGCVKVNNSAACNDASACTSGDTCTGGACKGAIVLCDDKNPCTTDSCDAAKGCVFANNTAACDDGSACTSGDTCGAGACLGKTLVCNDNNGCTTDGCDAKTGCTTAANSLGCDDLNACTGKDLCAGGKCTPGAVVSCDDKNPCTNDSCDKAKGCVHVSNTLACDDGNGCTISDACVAGVCKGSGGPDCNDNNPCTTDGCTAKTGCTHVNNTAPCSDNNACTTADKCLTAKCVGGVAADCDDKNSCTADACEPVKGCTHANNTAGCNDNNACTVGDVCAAGACKPGAAANCDDQNPCTNDTCDAIQGCAHVNNAVTCNDKNACTQTDKCSNGVCLGSGAPSCDDANPCTTDSCDVTLGCTHNANSSPCDDKNACTSGDKCAANACAPGAAVVCDDKNPCTNDSCDPAKGCVVTANTATCDDGNPCTSGEKCATGACGGGVAKVCDDANPCTNDACNTANGACGFKLGTTCVAKGLPYVDVIDCGDKDWVGTPLSGTTGWGIDATPGTPGKLSGLCSLNFNNGTNYSNGSSASAGSSMSAFLFDATTAGKVTLSFMSFNGNDPGETSDSWDQRWVEASIDGFATLAVTKQLGTNANKNAWVNEAIDLSLLAGKKFQVRFRFTTGDGNVNAGPGWFVENINVYAGPIWAPTVAVPVVEAFAAGNANGWRFSTATGGVTWAIDATAGNPGKLDGDASLNFNNGTNFTITSGSSAQGTATAPVIDLTGVAAGVKASLLFRSWYDTESGATYDQRWVEVSADDFTTTPIKIQLDSSKSAKGWTFEAIDLSTLVGKKVRLRFRFDSIDSSVNGGAGWFVDALNLLVEPKPSFGDGIVCSNKTAWTFANAQAGVGWDIDATVSPPGFASADCSLNFNNGTNFNCPSGASKVAGTATSVTFATTAPPAGQKMYLRYKAFIETETDPYDLVKIEVSDHGFGTPANLVFNVPKTSLGTWTTQAVDISALAGKTLQIRFNFDSVDCVSNATKGVFIDDVLIQAGP